MLAFNGNRFAAEQLLQQTLDYGLFPNSALTVQCRNSLSNQCLHISEPPVTLQNVVTCAAFPCLDELKDVYFPHVVHRTSCLKVR